MKSAAETGHTGRRENPTNPVIISGLLQKLGESASIVHNERARPLVMMGLSWSELGIHNPEAVFKRRLSPEKTIG